MKGNERVIATLNDRLAEELSAINVYMLHSEMCENWGYEVLHAYIRKQSIDEMKHAEWLIERILFLDAVPSVLNLKPMKVGKSVEEIIRLGLDDELDAVAKYNESIKIAVEAGDNGSKELLEKILEMEEGHVDWSEAQLDQIEQMGIQNYLAMQTTKE